MSDSRTSASSGGKSLGTLNDVHFFTVDDGGGKEQGRKEGPKEKGTVGRRRGTLSLFVMTIKSRRDSARDVLLRLLVLCCHSLLTHWHNSCWADWPAQAGSNRKAGRGKSMKLKLLLLYSIHATYGRIQMTEMPKSLKKTSMPIDVLYFTSSDAHARIA